MVELTHYCLLPKCTESMSKIKNYQHYKQGPYDEKNTLIQLTGSEMATKV